VDAFALIVLGGLVLVVLGLLALGAWNPHSISQLTGRSDERRLADQAMIEEGDIEQMVEAQNVSRRRRGKREMTEAEIRERANVSQRRSIEQAEREE
jgi:hypothetical protein